MSESNDTSTHSKPLRIMAGAAVLVFAIGALAIGLIRELQSPDSDGKRGGESSSQVATVYYFHGDVRCETCLTIEARSTETVRRHFADELEAGTLRFQIVNFDSPENTHYRQDFELAFGTVLVRASGVDAAWENLAEVWVLVHESPEKFERYLVEHITPHLEPAG